MSLVRHPKRPGEDNDGEANKRPRTDSPTSEGMQIDEPTDIRSQYPGRFLIAVQLAVLKAHNSDEIIAGNVVYNVKHLLIQNGYDAPIIEDLGTYSSLQKANDRAMEVFWGLYEDFGGYIVGEDTEFVDVDKGWNARADDPWEKFEWGQVGWRVDKDGALNLYKKGGEDEDEDLAWVHVKKSILDN